MATIPLGVNTPWLFEIFPELQKHLPWTSLVSAPTRVEKLETVSA